MQWITRRAASVATAGRIINQLVRTFSVAFSNFYGLILATAPMIDQIIFEFNAVGDPSPGEKVVTYMIKPVIVLLPHLFITSRIDQKSFVCQRLFQSAGVKQELILNYKKHAHSVFERIHDPHHLDSFQALLFNFTITWKILLLVRKNLPHLSLKAE